MNPHRATETMTLAVKESIPTVPEVLTEPVREAVGATVEVPVYVLEKVRAARTNEEIEKARWGVEEYLNHAKSGVRQPPRGHLTEVDHDRIKADVTEVVKQLTGATPAGSQAFTRTDTSKGMAFKSKDSVLVQECQYYFRRNNSCWDICFEGRPFHMPHFKGLEYEATALAMPGMTVAVMSLIKTDQEPVPSLLAQKGDGILDDCSGSVGSPFNSDEKMDQKYLRNLLDEIKSLESELDQPDLPPQLQSAYENDLAECRKRLRSDRRANGLIRKFEISHLRGPTRAVREACRRAETLITKYSPELTRHLNAFVRCESGCLIYTPSPKVVWDVQM